MSDVQKRVAAKSIKEKVRDHRARMRARGLRAVTYWLPDTSTAEFQAEAARQSLLAAGAAEDAEINAFLMSANDWPPDDSDAPAHR